MAANNPHQRMAPSSRFVFLEVSIEVRLSRRSPRLRVERSAAVIIRRQPRARPTSSSFFEFGDFCSRRNRQLEHLPGQHRWRTNRGRRMDHGIRRFQRDQRERCRRCQPDGRRQERNMLIELNGNNLCGLWNEYKSHCRWHSGHSDLPDRSGNCRNIFADTDDTCLRIHCQRAPCHWNRHRRNHHHHPTSFTVSERTSLCPS